MNVLRAMRIVELSFYFYQIIVTGSKVHSRRSAPGPEAGPILRDHNSSDSQERVGSRLNDHPIRADV
jgi:hypothetical protein